MEQVMLWAVIYIGTMALGYFLKRAGVFCRKDQTVLSHIILYITLPAMIISSFTGVTVDLWFLAAMGIGWGANLLLIIISQVFSRRKTKELRALYLINSCGYNLGNITMPFLHNFFPQSIPYLCMFDTGDSFFSLGSSYAIASAMLGKKEGSPVGKVLKELIASVPFDAYLFMMVLSLAGFSLPDSLQTAAEFLGKGNGCIAMLMVGIAFEPDFSRQDIKEVISVLGIRYVCGAIMAAGVFILLPAPLAMRQGIAVAFFSATANVCLIFSNRLVPTSALASTLNPISTLIAIPLMSVITMILL